jgi:hypothetical protein
MGFHGFVSPCLLFVFQEHMLTSLPKYSLIWLNHKQFCQLSFLFSQCASWCHIYTWCCPYGRLLDFWQIWSDSQTPAHPTIAWHNPGAHIGEVTTKNEMKQWDRKMPRLVATILFLVWLLESSTEKVCTHSIWVVQGSAQEISVRIISTLFWAIFNCGPNLPLRINYLLDKKRVHAHNLNLLHYTIILNCLT